MEVIGWHGTTQKNEESIIKNGFKNLKTDFSKNEVRVPNDLGNGIYFYIDFRKTSGKTLAQKYVRSYRDRIAREQKCSFSVIEAEITCEDECLLDMDEFENLKMFYEFNEKHTSTRNQMITKLKSDGAKKRKNYDGIMMELFIREIHKQFKEVKVVKKDTNTIFESEISNFANGTELCVRNLECVKLRSKGENNGNEFKKFLQS